MRWIVLGAGLGGGLLLGCGGDVTEIEGDAEALGAVSSECSGPPSAPTVKLKKKNKAVFWDGAVSIDDPIDPDAPPECGGAPCQHVKLKIDLPNGTFNNPNKPGGVQVALRWFGNPGPHTLPPGVPGCCGEFDTLHLFVYKDGELRGVSAGIIAVAQSAFLPAPENGIYDVWIAYDPSYNVGETVEYEALADVEFAENIQPNKRLLPDLSFNSTERITFESPSFPIFEPDPPPGANCYQSEALEDGAVNCLRYDQIISNLGKGAVEIAWEAPANEFPDEGEDFPVVQNIYRSGGSVDTQPGGEVHFHAVHSHYHYTSFASTALWASNAQGAKLGGGPVRLAEKQSFCFADIRIEKWGEKGDGPRTYYAPDCLFPESSDGVTDFYRQGITAGWADVYDWYLPGQYIDVNGVSDGYYVLEMCADPENKIEEADETNNCIKNHIRLLNVDTPSQTVQVLGVVD